MDRVEGRRYNIHGRRRVNFGAEINSVSRRHESGGKKEVSTKMATLRDCFFAYTHEMAGANLDEEVKIVRLKRVDADVEVRVCEACAGGLLSTGNFVVVEETPAQPAVEESHIEPVALQDLLDEGTTVEDVSDDGGEGNP
jgi:hypothetical protein